MATVDVIVPCYRYGHFLRQCVESVLAQSGADARILIIDDASPDNTAEVAAELAKQDARVSVIRHTVNKGHIYTYNEGIDWASADYMLILSADDFLLPGALRRAVSLMDAHPEVGLTCGKAIVLMDGAAMESTTISLDTACGYQIVRGKDFIHLSGSRNIVHTPTAVVRTEVQQCVGYYRLALPHSGDMEMWLRFATRASVGILKSYQAVYRRHTANMSLIYFGNGPFADIEQRKAAIESFIDTCQDRLPDAKRLHQQLLRSLGCDALGFASMAFNAGDMRSCEQLSTMARHISPEVNRSRPWIKLTCKRIVGLRAWRVFQPAIAWVRPSDSEQ